MLAELHVQDLGVIEDAKLDLGPGMTALTGETGAGKTLIVEALELLLGARADSVLVRPGARRAFVEGRFVVGDDETIVAREVPADGRSRAWVDGRMAPAGTVAELGSALVDLHGQHAHQSLLRPDSQRAALDSFAGIDLSELEAARARLAEIESELAALGGDERTRTREIDLLRYQLEEIERASITGADEDETLAEEEERLADAASHKEAAVEALRSLDPERGAGGAVDLVGDAVSATDRRPPLRGLSERLAGAQAELIDVASELRTVVETWEEDPSRLADVQARRHLLRELSRKYGEGPAGILAYANEARARLEALDATEERTAALTSEILQAQQVLRRAEAYVGEKRRRNAAGLAKAVEGRLRSLAMPKARFEVLVGDTDPGDDVRFVFGANPGEPVLPLVKIASGGELARAMLALRLVLTEAPPTMVFDEVDAGVGGEAAIAVGEALAEVSRRHQVVVVTHLAQVAAFAEHQISVTKQVSGGRTVASVRELDGEDRVAELARMLSGRPDSSTARRHAEELLSTRDKLPRRRNSGAA
jgi:DNA repair protein RecN (Recombination protein N)